MHRYTCRSVGTDVGAPVDDIHRAVHSRTSIYFVASPARRVIRHDGNTGVVSAQKFER